MALAALAPVVFGAYDSYPSNHMCIALSQIDLAIDIYVVRIQVGLRGGRCGEAVAVAVAAAAAAAREQVTLIYL